MAKANEGNSNELVELVTQNIQEILKKNGKVINVQDLSPVVLRFLQFLKSPRDFADEQPKQLFKHRKEVQALPKNHPQYQKAEKDHIQVDTDYIKLDGEWLNMTRDQKRDMKSLANALDYLPSILEGIENPGQQQVIEEIKKLADGIENIARVDFLREELNKVLHGKGAGIAFGHSLHEAVKKGDIEEVTRLCKNSNVNSQDYYDNSTPLHIAVQLNRADIVSTLLKHGASIDLQDDNGNTPLHLASQKSYNKIAEILVTSIKVPNDERGDGSTVDKLNKDRNSALLIAVLANNIELVRILLDKNAKINQRVWDPNEPFAPIPMVLLSYAIKRKISDDMLKELLEQGALVADDTEALYNFSKHHPPVHEAINSGNVEHLKMLIKYGVDTTLPNSLAFVSYNKDSLTPIDLIKSLDKYETTQSRSRKKMMELILMHNEEIKETFSLFKDIYHNRKCPDYCNDEKLKKLKFFLTQGTLTWTIQQEYKLGSQYKSVVKARDIVKEVNNMIEHKDFKNISSTDRENRSVVEQAQQIVSRMYRCNLQHLLTLLCHYCVNQVLNCVNQVLKANPCQAPAISVSSGKPCIFSLTQNLIFTLFYQFDWW